jgi:hypothetical protein
MIVTGTDGTMIGQSNILRCILIGIVSHEFEVIAFSLGRELILWWEVSSVRYRSSSLCDPLSAIQDLLSSYQYTV